MNADPIRRIVAYIDGNDYDHDHGFPPYDQADEIRERCRMAPDTPRRLSMQTDYPPLPRRARIAAIGPVWLGVGVGVLGLLVTVALVYALIVVIGTGHALELPPSFGGGR